MQIELIGGYEVTYQPEAAPALVIHHLVRGYDAVTLDADAAAELGSLLRETQKRIRAVGGYQLIFGEGGDLVIHAPNGQRAAYFNADQAMQLGKMFAPTASV